MEEGVGVEEEVGGGGCWTTSSCFGAGCCGAGGFGLGLGLGLGLGAGELPLPEDEPPEQRPLVLGLGKTRP